MAPWLQWSAVAYVVIGIGLSLAVWRLIGDEFMKDAPFPHEAVMPFALLMIAAVWPWVVFQAFQGLREEWRERHR